jgi:hypothetical protein
MFHTLLDIAFIVAFAATLVALHHWARADRFATRRPRPFE